MCKPSPKRLVAFMAVACAVVFGAEQSARASLELVVNGTFDSDLTAWTQGGGIATTWDDETAHVGRPGTPGTSIFEQVINIPSGTPKLTIEFDYEWQVVAPTLQDSFTVDFLYLSTSGLQSVNLLTEFSDAVVFESTMTYSDMISLTNLNGVPGNGTIRFTLEENNSDRGTRIQLDNVSISAVPEATPVLIWSTLMGLGLVRRWRRK